MNWDAIAAIGQVLGSMAVLITIAYLAMQVRQAREQLMRSERQSRFSSLREVFLVTAAHPELAAAMSKVHKGLGFPLQATRKLALDAGLTDTEGMQVHQMAWATWTNWEQLVDSFDHQSAGQQEQTRRHLRDQFTGTFMARWYELARDVIDPNAVRFIDEVLKERP